MTLFSEPLAKAMEWLHDVPMYGIEIVAHSGTSQYKQLYQQFRQKILQGSLAPSSKLASTRQLASELKLSRAIVLEVIDQLKAEGFLETRRGSGTFVVPSLTYKEGFSLPKPASVAQEESTALSFIPGVPELDLFPRRIWNQCYSRALEYAGPEDLGYTPAMGREDLRQAIARYLFRFKGIDVSSDHIVITAGSAQALAILAQLSKKQKIVLEDPLAGFVERIFREQGCILSFASVDDQGILPDSLPKERQDLIYVSPSHQFPLGGTLPAQRRVELLNRASKEGSYIIEDDYDGEYRYGQRPIAPMQVLGPHRVVYIGTFSKILSPALRLGYMVIPPGLMKAIKKLKSRWEFFNEGLNQMAMVSFIEEGHLERHLRRMIKLYGNRKKQLEELIKEILGEGWNILGNTTGLHLILHRPGAVFDEGFKKKLMARGVRIVTVENYSFQTRDHLDKLVLGYGNRSLEELEKGLKVLAALVD